MTHSLNTIDKESVESARNKAVAKILKKRREAAATRLIADKLSGQYITKRIEPQLAAIFPDADHTFLSQSYSSVSAVVVYDKANYSDHDSIFLCNTSNRRLDRTAIIARAEHQEKEARALELSLQHIEDMVDAYNDMAARYAEIREDLSHFFPDIPWADYELERRSSITPERFADSIPA